MARENTPADLDRHRYVTLATFRRNGAAVATPVWFAAVDSTLWVFTAGDSGKVKRLRHTSRVRIAPCDVRGDVKGPWQDATARLATDASAIERAHEALRAKYGWQMWVGDVLARATGRMGRRAWIEITP
jgi:hypothetical protein